MLGSITFLILVKKNCFNVTRDKGHRHALKITAFELTTFIDSLEGVISQTEISLTSRSNWRGCKL